jgi:hypothetical protein
MEIILIMFVVFMVANAVGVMQAIKPQNDKSSVIKEKNCPPHKWRHEEIKDHEGTVHGWKLVCDICGPLKSQEEVTREI